MAGLGPYPGIGIPLYDDAPDPNSLQWPWSAPPPALDPAAGPPPPPEAASETPSDEPVLAPSDAPDDLDGPVFTPAQADVAPPAPEMAAPPAAAGPPLAQLGEPEVGPVPLAAAPIEPEQLDVTPVTPEDFYARDPLHSPDPEQARAYADEASRDDLMAKRAEIDIARQQSRVVEQARIDEENLVQMRRNAEARRIADAESAKKTAAILADASRMAGPDPGRWMSSRTTAQKIAAFATGIIGGLIQGRTGAQRNAGMDAIQQMIDQDIDAQKADIENGRYQLGLRQGAVAQEYARTGNAFEAAETVRQAAYQAMINKLQTEQQNFDPRGTSWINYGLARRDLEAKKAESALKLQKGLNDAAFKLREIELREQAQADANRRAREQLGLGYAQLKSAAADRAENRADRVLAREEAREERALVRETTRAETDRKNAREDAATQRELSIGSFPRVARGTDGNPLTDQAGNPVVEDAGAELKQKDGTAFLAPDKDARKGLADKMLAASMINDIVGEMLAIRRSVGGESRLFNSDELQRLKVLNNQLVLLKKQGTHGMSSDTDMTRIEGALGAEDVTSFRERTAGLEKGRDITNNELNKAFRLAKYTGPVITFPDQWASKATKSTEEEDRLQALLRKPKGSPTDRMNEAFEAALRERTKDMSPDELRAFGPTKPGQGSLPIAESAKPAADRRWLPPANASPQQRAVWDEVVRTFDADLSLAQTQEIDRLIDAARGSGPAAERARAALQEVQDKSPNAKLRKTAKDALFSTVGGFTPPGEPSED